MSKKNKQKFEFCVGTSNSHRSTVWKVIVSKNDVYVIPTASNSYFKVSLHGSGVCQIAVTSERLDELNIPKEERPGQRWKFEVEEENSNIVFAIDFLNFFLVDFSGKEELKEGITLIAPPEDGRNTEILFYKVKATLPVEGLFPKGYTLLRYFQLDNGELLTILYHYPIFTEHNKQVFVEGYRQAIAHKGRAGITAEMVPGYLSTDEINGYIHYIEIFI